MIFQYKTKTKENVIVFKLIGELIEREQPKVMLEDIVETLESGHKNILLDLQDLKYINSSGFTILINIITKVNAAGGKLSVCHANERITELFHITKLSRKFNEYKTEEESIAFLNK